MFWGCLPLWEWWAELKFQGQERGWGISGFLGLACGSTGSHVLSLTSSSMGMVSVSCTSYEKGGVDSWASLGPARKQEGMIGTM